jgi:UMF1 family MFS transporter
MVGLLTPGDRKAEFSGLWSFATHLSVVIGPMTYGLLTLLTDGNHRIAIVSTSLFFAGGLWLLMPLDMKRGRQIAREAT